MPDHPPPSIMPGRTWHDNGHKALCPLPLAAGTRICDGLDARRAPPRRNLFTTWAHGDRNSWRELWEQPCSGWSTGAALSSGSSSAAKYACLCTLDRRSTAGCPRPREKGYQRHRRTGLSPPPARPRPSSRLAAGATRLRLEFAAGGEAEERGVVHMATAGSKRSAPSGSQPSKPPSSKKRYLNEDRAWNRCRVVWG